MNSKDFSTIIMHFLELKRRKKGWSQEDLSFRTHFSRSDISHLESGRKELKIYELILLCKALDINRDNIIDDALKYAEKHFSVGS